MLSATSSNAVESSTLFVSSLQHSLAGWTGGRITQADSEAASLRLSDSLRLRHSSLAGGGPPPGGMMSSNDHPHIHVTMAAGDSGNSGNSSASDPLDGLNLPAALSPGPYYGGSPAGDACQLAGSLKRRCSLTSPLPTGSVVARPTQADSQSGAELLAASGAQTSPWQSDSCGSQGMGSHLASILEAALAQHLPMDLRLPQFESGSASGSATQVVHRSSSQPHLLHQDGDDGSGGPCGNQMKAPDLHNGSSQATQGERRVGVAGTSSALDLPVGSSRQQLPPVAVGNSAIINSNWQPDAAAHRHSDPQVFQFPPRLGITLPTQADMPVDWMAFSSDSPSKRRKAIEPTRDSAGTAIGLMNLPGSSFGGGSGGGCSSISGEFPIASSGELLQGAARKFPWGRIGANSRGGGRGDGDHYRQVSRSAEMPLQTAGPVSHGVNGTGRCSPSPFSRSPLGGGRGQAGRSMLGVSHVTAPMQAADPQSQDSHHHHHHNHQHSDAAVVTSGGHGMEGSGLTQAGGDSFRIGNLDLKFVHGSVGDAADVGNNSNALAGRIQGHEPADVKQQRVVRAMQNQSHYQNNNWSENQSGGRIQQQHHPRVMNDSLSSILARKHGLSVSNQQLLTATIKAEGVQSSSQGYAMQGLNSPAPIGTGSTAIAATGGGAAAAAGSGTCPAPLAGSDGLTPSTASESDLPGLQLAGSFDGSTASIERQMEALDAILKSFPASITGDGEGGWNGNSMALEGTGTMPSMDALLMGNSNNEGSVPAARVAPPATAPPAAAITGGAAAARGGGYGAAGGNREFSWTEQLQSMAEQQTVAPHQSCHASPPLSTLHVSGTASALALPTLTSPTGQANNPGSLEGAASLLAHSLDAGSLDSPGSGSNRARRALAAMAAGINLGSAQLDALLPLAGAATSVNLKQCDLDALLRDAPLPCGGTTLGSSNPLLPINTHRGVAFTSNSLPARRILAPTGTASRLHSDADIMQTSSLGTAPFPGRSSMHMCPTSSSTLQESSSGKNPSSDVVPGGGSAGQFPLSAACKNDGAVLHGYAETSARKIFEQRQAAQRAAEEREGRQGRGRTREQKKALEQDRRAQEREGFSRLRSTVPVPFVTQYAHETGRQPAPGKKEVDLGTLLRAAASYIGLLQEQRRQLQASTIVAELQGKLHGGGLGNWPSL